MSASNWREIQRSEVAYLKEIDSNIKNGFRWAWLEEKDCNDNFLSDYIRKVNIAGKVLCTYCNQLLSHKSGGKNDIKKHAAKKSHQNVLKLRKTNTTLPAVMQLSKPSSSSSSNCTITYGAPPNVHNEQACLVKRPQPSSQIVSFQDRLAHAEAMTVSFLAENTLPFTFAPKLVQFTQELAKDSKVLQSMSMSKDAASYKLKEGLAPLLLENLVTDLQNNFFSINVDECFSNANEKVFSITATYFSDDCNYVKLQHYNSAAFTVVNAKTLFDYVKMCFTKDNIPFTNLISDLSDSTNYMRGKKSGFETLLRNEAPHLLDIDGDICHHTHNSVKAFLNPFNSYIEKLLTDLRTDMKWSPDLRSYLAEICEFLNISYRMPADRVEHRWLSCYDALVVDEPLLPALTVLYYSWVPQTDRDVYKDDFKQLIQVCKC